MKRDYEANVPARIKWIALYARSATSDGTRMQIAEGIAYAKKCKLRVEEIYEDYGFPGSMPTKAPNLCRMIEDAKFGRFSALVTRDLTRFSRQPQILDDTLKQLGSCGIRVFTIGQGHLAVLAANGVTNNKNNNKRIAAGKRFANLKGLHQSRTPYGYIRTSATGVLAVHPERAKTILKIFNRAASKENSAKIADMLKVPNPADCNRIDAGETIKSLGPWTKHMITKFVQHPRYKGRLIAGIRPTDAGKDLHPVDIDAPNLRIVSDELWNEANIGLRAANAVRKRAAWTFRKGTSLKHRKNPLGKFVQDRE